MSLKDSHDAYMKLRFTPKQYASGVGDSGKKGWLTLLGILGGFFFLVYDIFRHYLILFLTDDVTLISLNVVNPFNGNTFAITNRQVMDATYFTGVIFMGQLVSSSILHGAEKTVSQTRFIKRS